MAPSAIDPNPEQNVAALDDDYQGQLAGAARRNLSIFAGVHGMWGFGSAFVSHVALLPVFLRALGAPYFIVGALPALMTICMFGPQILAAQMTGHLRRKKNIFAAIHYPGCIGIVVMAACTYAWGKSNPKLLIPVVLACMAVQGLSLSFAIPMWSNLIAKLLPAETRGRSFGLLFFIGGLTGAAGALLSERLIDGLEFPSGFAAGFLIAGIVPGLSVSFFFLLKEPLGEETAPRGRLGDFLRNLRQDLRGQPDYQFYLLAQISSGLARLAVPFYAVAALERFELDVKVGATFTAILLISRTLGSPLAGRIGDRFGFRCLALFPPTFVIVSALLALTAGSPTAFYVIFALTGFASAAESVANFNLPIEFCPHADKTSFIAIRGTIVSPVQAVAPMLGGLVADALDGGFAVLFFTAAVLEVCSLLVLTFFVREPRRKIGH